jgi:hypothetical protein
MKKITTRSKLLVTALAAVLTSGASAQSLTGATNAAVQGATSIATPPPPAPPPPPPPPAVSAGAVASGAAQGAAGAVVRPPLAPPSAAQAQSSGTANSAVSGSTTTGVNANATTNASATGQARGLTVATEASRQVSVTANPAETVARIQQSTFANRDLVMAELQGRLDTSAQVITALEIKADRTGDQSRAAFAKALVEVRAREKDMRTSLRDAAKATKESSWGEIQSALAKDYGAYAKAMAEAEAAAGASATGSATK